MFAVSVDVPARRRDASVPERAAVARDVMPSPARDRRGQAVTDRVVLAAGVWSRVARADGFDLPAEPERR
jgi:glycine/D-amino acid oxidase-like deaminating enzyme